VGSITLGQITQANPLELSPSWINIAYLTFQVNRWHRAWL
jgi:hypothetical protein